MSPSKFVLDVDGVLTDGGFYYDQSGQKALKRFGPDDADALKLLSQFFDIVFVSADERGFPISSSRVKHLGFSIFNVSSDERLVTIYICQNFLDLPNRLHYSNFSFYYMILSYR